MSWIRDHFHQFVFPAMKAQRFHQRVLKGQAEQSDLAAPCDYSMTPVSGWVTPWSSGFPAEIIKLDALNTDYGIPMGPGSWQPQTAKALPFWRNVVTSLSATRKAWGCPRVVFFGLDAWPLAVLAARKKVPFIHVPELHSVYTSCTFPGIEALVKKYQLSRKDLFMMVAQNHHATYNLSHALEIHPRELRLQVIHRGPLLSYPSDAIYPCRTLTSGDIGVLCNLPSYWKMPRFVGAEVTQELSDLHLLYVTAIITSGLYRGHIR